MPLDNSFVFDTSILLHDFFFRYPEYAGASHSSEESNTLSEYRAIVNEALHTISSLPQSRVFIPSFILARYISVLTDRNVSEDIVLDEAMHWYNNAEIIEAELNLEATANIAKQASVKLEPALLLNAALKVDAAFIFAANPTWETKFSELRFITPLKLLNALNV
jgi:hypothetical protein